MSNDWIRVRRLYVFLMHVRIFIYFYLKTMLICTLHDTGVCRIFCMVYSYILLPGQKLFEKSKFGGRKQ